MRMKKLLTAICVVLAVALPLPVAAGVQPRRNQRAKARVVKSQSASVDLTERGYEPASIRLRRGVPARVTFTRKVSSTCATEVVLPDYGIRRALPLNEPVAVEFTPKKSGEFTFSCGMGMIKGSLILR
jgi:plastocyanin domain-containing protein